jgi:Pup amidohydrolase
MLDRLVGQETEYAIRFSPAGEDGARPGNERIYRAIREAIRAEVDTLPGRRRAGRKRLFTQNGGTFCYESLSSEPDGGLLEGGTPECRGPSQLLLYQQAQDALLVRAVGRAQHALAFSGYPGELGLLRNGRDGFGNVYGPQENYEVSVGPRWALWAWRAGLAALVPVVFLLLPFFWLTLLVLMVVLWAAVFGTLAADLLSRLVVKGGFDAERWLLGDERRLEKAVGRVDPWLSTILLAPVVVPFSLLVRAVAFRRVRRGITAFLVSRPVVSGTGTVFEDGRFGLSEKGPDTRRVIRQSALPAGRAIFDTGNLMKGLAMPALLEFGGLWRLFRPEQRMQLGLADANLCQAAEYIRVGATTLIIDMAEAGALDDAPRLKRPIAALHAIIADPTLKAEVALRAGGSMTALALQRWYLERAEAWVSAAAVPSLEAPEVLRLWREALDALRDDPGSLVGRLDWVTKRYLIERAAPEGPPVARKKIDLRYSELGEGYLAQMEAAGLAPRLVSPEEAWEAVFRAPADTPARQRGRLVQQLADADETVGVGWDTVRIGGGLRGRVVSLDEFRKRRRDE